jgi:D-amino peptidase
VDAVFFVGYHARMGTLSAILDHTWPSVRVSNVWLKGRITGEIGLNASLCGYFGTPVLMVTGDQSANAEAAEWVLGVENVVVKRANGRSSAELLPPVITQAMISEVTARAIRSYQDNKGPAPLVVETPVRGTVEFFNSEMADLACTLPWISRLERRKIEMVLPNMPAAYLAFRSAVMLAVH